jgi:hypothetical protein
MKMRWCMFAVIHIDSYYRARVKRPLMPTPEPCVGSRSILIAALIN